MRALRGRERRYECPRRAQLRLVGECHPFPRVAERRRDDAVIEVEGRPAALRLTDDEARGGFLRDVQAARIGTAAVPFTRCEVPVSSMVGSVDLEPYAVAVAPLRMRANVKRPP